MLRQMTRYFIECDVCAKFPIPDHAKFFHTKEEAEAHAAAHGMIQISDDGALICETCHQIRLAREKGERCIVKDCENHTNEGTFVGSLCSPCHRFIVLGIANNSQAARNAIRQAGVFVKAFVDLVGAGKVAILEGNGPAEIRIGST